MRDPPWDPSQTPPRPPVCPPLMLCPLPRLTPGLEPALQDDRAFVFTNGTLRLGPAARGDGGPFTCRAHNAHSNASVIAHLDVKGTGTPGDPPRPATAHDTPGMSLIPLENVWDSQILPGTPRSPPRVTSEPPQGPPNPSWDLTELSSLPQILSSTPQSLPRTPKSFLGLPKPSCAFQILPESPPKPLQGPPPPSFLVPPRALQGPPNPSWDPPVPPQVFSGIPESLIEPPRSFLGSPRAIPCPPNPS